MANNYSKLSKEGLLKVIEKLKTPKRYGLIWDEERTKEQFEKESENALPVLKEVKNKEIETDSSKPVNILIEGDNYHALSVLNYTHQEKIDVISLLSHYNSNSFNWLSLFVLSSLRLVSISACNICVLSKIVTLKICRIV